MGSPLAEAETLPFEHSELFFHRLHDEAQQLMARGVLPFDALFRLASIGVCEVDPDAIDAPWQKSKNLLRNLFTDMVENADSSDSMRANTQSLLFGERPPVIIDPYTSSNYGAYSKLEPMYYRMADLAHAIQEKREQQGKTVTESLDDSYFDPARLEWRTCVGLARPTWRAIAKRMMPQIFERPNDFYAPQISFNQVYSVSKRTAIRRLVASAVVCDTNVFRIYQEARETGVKGLGTGARESLRIMLAEVHPELY